MAALYLTHHHVNRIAFLAGAGCSLSEILDDLEMTDGNLVRQMMAQNGLELSAGPKGRRTVPVQVGPQAFAGFRDAAVSRDIIGADKAKRLLQRVVDIIGRDASLLDNILSDGIKTGARK